MITRGVRFLITIILARLLEPEDFGLVAIGLLVVNSISMFRDLGVGSALIYYSGDIKKAANTTLTMLPIIGVVLTVFTFLLAPLFADFLGNADSEPIIKVLSFSLLLVSLGITPSMLLDKELEFKKQVFPEVGSILSYGVTAIVLAYQGFGAWSIVYGKVMSLVIWLVILWHISPWKPRPEFDVKIAKSLFGYGRHIMGATLIYFLLTNVDNGFVAKFIGTTALGYYSMAYNISNLPAMNISGLVNRVMFPTYSKIKDNRETLIRIYLKNIKYISLVSVPLSLEILVLAPEIIMVLLGEKWLPALVPLQILCLTALFRSIVGTTGTLFNAIGRPEISERLSLYQLVFLGIIIYPLSVSYGIVGTSIAITVPGIIFTIISYKVANDLLRIGLRGYVDSLSMAFMASAFMVAATATAQAFMPLTGVIRFAALIVVGCASYCGFIYLVGKEVLDEVLDILKTFK